MRKNVAKLKRMKDYIELEFILRPEREMHLLESEQMQMVKWCREKGMNMTVLENPVDLTKTVRVKFYRDKNTHDFIVKFLETPVGHALPYKSLETIPDVRVIQSE